MSCEPTCPPLSTRHAVPTGKSGQQSRQDKRGTEKKINTSLKDTLQRPRPYLSDDGQTLILVSDRPGGFGGLDLYDSTRKKTLIIKQPIERKTKLKGKL